MRTVIFDLDGTLADTSGDLIAAANACFRALGHGDVLDARADQALAVRGGRAMLTEGFARVGVEDATAVEREFPLFLGHYTRDIARHTTLYPGMVPALERLLADGYCVGMCTNKPGKQTHMLLERLGIGHLFASVVAADTLPVRKPDAAPVVEAVKRAGGAMARAVLVGDTVTDREAARAAGIASLLVTFGPGGDAVAALEPEGLLDDFGALGGAVERLIG